MAKTEDLRTKFQAVATALKSQFVEREDVIDGMLCAALAGEHVLMVGAPGSAKSKLVTAFTSMVGAQCFEWLLGKFTVPEELFGPISLEALKREQYKRVTTGKLPEAEVAFLDEALALDTPMLTPNGWVTMGEVQVGDHVFGSAGQPVQITGLTAIEFAADCYEVEFRDGTMLVASGGHLWATQNHAGTERVLTTVEVAEALGAGFRVTVPMPKAIELPEAELPIDPYTLGVWLGNGNCWTGELYVREAWVERTLELVKRAYPGAERGRRLPGMFAVSMGGTGFRTKLREADLINAKRVPDIYLRGSVAQRLSLLRGLLDTDGYMGVEGTCIFSNTIESIVDAVVYLVRSLGIRCTKVLTTDDRVGARGPHKACWKVTFRADPERSPFAARPVTIPRLVQSGRKAIVAVRPVDSVPVRCLRVDAADHLFVAGESLTLTHNCFKANSAILNTLLPVMNERKFYNNGTPVQIPLRMVVGASNELPDGAELAALYDRFLVRFHVEYITAADNWVRMVMGVPKGHSAAVTLIEWDRARKEVAAIEVTEDIARELHKLRDKLRTDHGVQLSDRRWFQCMGLLRAAAWLSGEKQVIEDHLLALAPALWNDLEQIGPVTKAVEAIAGSITIEATKVARLIEEQVNALQMPAPGEKPSVEQQKEMVTINRETARALAKLGELEKQAKTDRARELVKASRVKVEQMLVPVRQTLREALGL